MTNLAAWLKLKKPNYLHSSSSLSALSGKAVGGFWPQWTTLSYESGLSKMRKTKTTTRTQHLLVSVNHLCPSFSSAKHQPMYLMKNGSLKVVFLSLLLRQQQHQTRICASVPSICLLRRVGVGRGQSLHRTQTLCVHTTNNTGRASAEAPLLSAREWPWQPGQHGDD